MHAPIVEAQGGSALTVTLNWAHDLLVGSLAKHYFGTTGGRSAPAGHMTTRDLLEAEIRGICGECVGTLRLLSESTGHLTGRKTKTLLDQARHLLESCFDLADRLP